MPITDIERMKDGALHRLSFFQCQNNRNLRNLSAISPMTSVIIKKLKAAIKL